ncbi:hypothetical protein [Streptomyces sp. NPDC007083]|uniref:hypothetical protein n=1 Tax=unclassified Streptomyces TaxID=2593676 RepID=UPI0033CA0113
MALRCCVRPTRPATRDDTVPESGDGTEASADESKETAMEESCKKAVIAAVAGGYLLGRTRKAKLALVLGTAVAGRRLGLDPQELVSKGLRKLSGTPQFAALTEQVQEELVGAARTALSSVTDRRIEAVTESLRGRTERLGSRGEVQDEEGSREKGDEGDQGGEGEEEAEEGAREEDGEPRRKPAERASARTAGSSRERTKSAAAGRKTAPARSSRRTTEGSSAKKSSSTSSKRSAARTSRRR